MALAPLDRRSLRRAPTRYALIIGALVLLAIPILPAGPYVTETSGIRWNDVGGLRWSDVGGIRWNDVGGIRWNDVGGIRWNDVGGVLWSDATGLRWNDVGGIRWNDVGGLIFDAPPPAGLAAIDPHLLVLYSTLPDSSSINVIVTYHAAPSASDLAALTALGIPGGTRFRRLPMVVVNATKDQIRAIATLPAVRSVFANRTLAIFDSDSGGLIGLPEVEADPALRSPGGAPLTGAGVTIAVIDTGIDGTHPDLPYGTKLVGNVRLSASAGTGPGFLHPVPTEGVVNTDLVLGHGTAVASVAAGSGLASAGEYAGVAPGASILGLSAGDLLIFNVLEGFDYVLDNRVRYGVRIVNCSWGTEGFFDPDDPVNIATRQLYDEGIVVVFAAGNHGPSPDTLNPYAVAPWVIGVGSVGRDGRLSSFSSRGIFEELLYRPVLLAPGEGIVAAKPAALGGVGGVVGVADPAGGAAVPPQLALHYAAVSGTSFSSPHVAGVVAMMLEATPTLTPADAKRILQATATPLLARDRSETGAGRLEAWAALTQAIDASRPFGSWIPGWTDMRSYRIEHRPPIVFEGLVPAGGSLSVPIDLDEAVASWGLTLAWGTNPGIGDLDLTVVDENGTLLARSESFNGTGLFGRTEGAHLMGAVPRAMTAQISFKANTSGFDQPIELRQETAAAVLTGFSDVASLIASDRDLLARAVSRHVIEGRGPRFEPNRALERGEMARSLALIAGLPQRIPSSASFPDVTASSPWFPFVESVAGARAATVLIDPNPGGLFSPGQAIDRLAFAVSMVRAAGLASEAEARAGETIGLTDDSSIPLMLRGYVIVALERGLVDTLASGSGRRFAPSGTVPRLNAARFLLRLLGVREGGLALAPWAILRAVPGTGEIPPAQKLEKIH